MFLDELVNFSGLAGLFECCHSTLTPSYRSDPPFSHLMFQFFLELTVVLRPNSAVSHYSNYTRSIPLLLEQEQQTLLRLEGYARPFSTRLSEFLLYVPNRLAHHPNRQYVRKLIWFFLPKFDLGMIWSRSAG